MYFSFLLKSSFSLGVVSLSVAIVAASAVPAMAGKTSALAPGAGFLKSWEKENLEGDFAGAAEEYEGVTGHSGRRPGAKLWARCG